MPAYSNEHYAEPMDDLTLRQSFSFIYSDGGRSLSKRPKQLRDCTIRAMAIVTGIDYDIIYDEFRIVGRRKSNTSFDLRGYLEMTDGQFGRWKFTWKSFNATKGTSRMNVRTFCQTHRTGRYIVKVSKHVFAVVDGVVYDEFRVREDRCVYGAHRVEECL